MNFNLRRVQSIAAIAVARGIAAAFGGGDRPDMHYLDAMAENPEDVGRLAELWEESRRQRESESRRQSSMY